MIAPLDSSPAEISMSAQLTQAVVRIREMIRRGKLAPGWRSGQK